MHSVAEVKMSKTSSWTIMWSQIQKYLFSVPHCASELRDESDNKGSILAKWDAVPVTETFRYVRRLKAKVWANVQSFDLPVVVWNGSCSNCVDPMLRKAIFLRYYLWVFELLWFPLTCPRSIRPGPALSSFTVPSTTPASTALIVILHGDPIRNQIPCKKKKKKKKKKGSRHL